MTCPTCQAEHSHPGTYCPRCGALLVALPQNEWDAEGGLIEGTIVEYDPAGDAPASADARDEGEPVGVSQAPTPSTSLVVARPAPLSLPSLPARLWRQPAVRAVARASAGALALTLGMRLVRGALTRPRTTGELASSTLPVLRHLFNRSPARTPPFGAASGQDADIVETFIYVRRVVRRR